MNPVSSKQVIAIDGASTTNAGTATGMIDTLGYSYATIDIKTSTSNNVTNNPSVLKLTEGDTTAITSASAVSGFTGDTDFTIPAAVTSGSWGAKFNVDLRGRKRYLFVSVSPVTTQTIDAVANLFRGEDAPNDATKAGVKVLVEG
jgi:hypothetical protein